MMMRMVLIGLVVVLAGMARANGGGVCQDADPVKLGTCCRQPQTESCQDQLWRDLAAQCCPPQRPPDCCPSPVDVAVTCADACQAVATATCEAASATCTAAAATCSQSVTCPTCPDVKPSCAKLVRSYDHKGRVRREHCVRWATVRVTPAE